jgi:DNA-binding GntR family transcriptional regulator
MRCVPARPTSPRSAGAWRAIERRENTGFRPSDLSFCTAIRARRTPCRGGGAALRYGAHVLFRRADCTFAGLGMTSQWNRVSPPISPLADPPGNGRTSPSARGDGRTTLAETLRLQLADEIIRGVLAPGVFLDETELARRFQVSRTPVREAIRQLAASGLVESRAHRGSLVAWPSHERLIGMFEAMAELEGLCAGLAAVRTTPEERRSLATVHGELRAMIRSGDPQRYHEINEAFHATIYAGAHNAYLAEITVATRARVQPFRRAQFRNLGRLAKSHVEHDRVVTAIMRGDRTGAAEAMRRHIITVCEEYEAYALSVSSPRAGP